MGMIGWKYNSAVIYSNFHARPGKNCAEAKDLEKINFDF